MVSSVISTVGSLIGANKSANAAKDAASIQAEAANNANATQLQIYNQNREDTMPWLQQGQAGLTKLSDLLGTSGNTSAEGYGSLLKPFGASDFTTDPGYQFTLQQGQQAIDRAMSRPGSAGYSRAQPPRLWTDLTRIPLLLNMTPLITVIIKTRATFTTVWRVFREPAKPPRNKWLVTARTMPINTVTT